MNIPNTITLPLNYIASANNLQITTATSPIKPTAQYLSHYQGISQIPNGTYNLDPRMLSNLAIEPEFFKLPAHDSTAILSTQSLPFKLNQSELRSISFETILDQPHSIKSLFSDEMKDLVKNLVEMQKQKLSIQMNSSDKINELTTSSSPSDFLNTNRTNPMEVSQAPSFQINHLLNNSQSSIQESDKPSERSQSQKSKQLWDEQSEVPYSKEKKKEGKSLAKSILFTIGRNLEKISKAIMDAGN